MKPYERQLLLLKLADLVEQEHRGAGAARHARHGRADQPHAQQPPARARHAALLRRHGDLDARRDDRQLAAGRYLLLHAEGAGRRRRRDHSVERPAHRVDLEDRPGARHRLHRRAEAGRGGAAHARCGWASSASKRACRRAWSMSCPATARPRAPRSPRIPTSTRSPSPARTSPARRSSRPRPATSSACRSSSAASRPTSSSPTPTSRPRCRAPAWRCSPIRARSAAPARGSSSSARSMTSSPRRWRPTAAA